MKKYSLRFQSTALLILLAAVTILNACKKEKTPEQVKAKAELSATIDGATYKVEQSGLSGSVFTDAGDAVKSVELNAALDASGRKFTFFINDLKAGKIILDPKTGSSMLPHPNNQIMQRLESINGRLMAGTGSGVQTYARYEFGGSSYYAYSGFFELTYEAETGKITMSWSITFKDATGKDFTSSGSFTIYINTLTTKPKSEVKDPTPVSATPTIESISPSAGTDGVEIAISGTNFSTTPGENQVKINNVTATVKSATATKLIINAPQGGTTGRITVKVKNSETATGPAFTYGKYPSITSFSSDNVKPGDQLTINGTNFSEVASENTVLFTTSGFSGASAAIVSATATQLIVMVPGSAISGNVTVQSKGFQSLNQKAITVTPIPVSNDITLFSPQSSNTVERFVVDVRSNVYSIYNAGTFTVRGADGTVKKTFTKADFDNHTGNIVALGKDQGGNACVAWTKYSGSKSWTTFYRIKDDFTSEKIGVEIALTQGSITMQRPFVVNKFNTIFYTDGFSIFSIENSLIDLTKRYLDGRGTGAMLYTDLIMDPNSNLCVLTKLATSSTENTQTIVRYNTDKEATVLYTYTTKTLASNDITTIPENTIGEFKAIIRNPNNEFFVADYGNRIRKLKANNQTEIIAGSGEYGRNNGDAYVLTGAKFATPVPKPVYLEYDIKNMRIYSAPSAYDKGVFMQAIQL